MVLVMKGLSLTGPVDSFSFFVIVVSFSLISNVKLKVATASNKVAAPSLSLPLPFISFTNSQKQRTVLVGSC